MFPRSLLSELAKPLLAIPVLAAVFLLIVTGPLGWVMLALFLLAGLAVRAAWTDDADAVPEKVNCPDCGARVAAGRDACDYCGASLDSPT
ncbi:zinc ribbon domain-containing protein [Halorarum salinum]|uniref:Zinc ribbon domain-containing protein n=1 Tax=Halorarum salinum TaxID=2743089 RepID=A0A7D5LDQ2_9EURY|nr:zinc ribbon domain-containing protein [Halobaculum salinum]QLG64271.1 zinc ribbon domain-containing protein [Halobaculum salinum]